MKNKLFYILILFSIICPVSAQEPAICGDWEEYYKTEVGFSLTRTIRITYNDGNYDVKMKIKNKDDNSVDYYTGAQITHSNENSISWHYLTDVYDDPDMKYKGYIVGFLENYLCCNIEMVEGVLIYTNHFRQLYYDRNGSYIGEWNGTNCHYGVMNKKEEEW